MDITAVEEFIDRWHEAVSDEVGDPEEKVEIKKLAPSLKDTLRRSSSVRKLATTPLLCAMLCALNRDRRQQIPSDRVDLYRVGCEMLLERLDAERNLDLKGYPKLSFRQKLVLLQDIAYWMIKNGWSEVDRGRVEERLSNTLLKMGGLTQDTTISDIYTLFVERSGIVREPVIGKMDFTHKTFQEFLAAKAALDERDIGALIRNAHDDQWREVTILAVGQASAKDSDELVEGLIKRGDAEPIYRGVLHLLAIASLRSSPVSSTDTNSSERKIAKMLPPRNMSEAQSLASAGDLAAPYLAFDPEYNEEIVAACVRALVIIGNDVALEMLKSYVADQSVINNLIQGWTAFNRDEYAKSIIALVIENNPDMPLELGRIPTLSGFDVLTNLKKLKIDDCSNINDFSPLLGLINLEELSLTLY